jgi:hypothetical protein
MTIQDIHARIEDIAEAGDDAALRDLLVGHFQDLPEPLQKKVLFALLEEDLEEQGTGSAIAVIQERGINALIGIEAFKEALAAA